MSARSWSIRRLLVLLVATTVVAASAASFLAVRASHAVNAAQTQLNDSTSARNAVDQFSILVGQSQLLQVTITAYPDVAAYQEKVLGQTEVQIAAVVATLREARVSAQARTAIATILAARAAWQTYFGSHFDQSTAAAQQVVAAKFTALNTTQATAVAATAKVLSADVARERNVSHQATQRLVALLLCFSIGGGVTVVLVLLVVGHQLVRRIGLLSDALSSLSAGDLTVTVDDTGSDEVAHMAKRVNGLSLRLRDVFSLIDQTSDRLAVSSNSLEGVAARVGASASDASDDAASVALAADEVSHNVQSVAAGSEEMRASIGEIARNANEAAAVATRAVGVVEATTATMTSLSTSSTQISDVVALIAAIAEQTNLLALNATIEAARAGDAGRGFAVVADEVKLLAQETAAATVNITKRVETIRTDADRAALSIQEVAVIMASIKDFQVTIAAAVEEQTATTRTMNSGATDAAAGTQLIAQSISGVADATRLSADSVAEARANATQLASMSQELADIVAAFTYR